MANKYNIRYSIEEAFFAIASNKLRSLLTATGIVFGVASVITMIAISRGSQKEILDQITKLGAKNIIIEQKKIKQGVFFISVLQLNDIYAIENIVTPVAHISPYVTKTAQIQIQNKLSKVTLAGVSNDFFKIFNIEIIEGSGFNTIQKENTMPVCIINEQLKRKLNFIGDTNNTIKTDKIWMKIIGVYKPFKQAKKTDLNLEFLNNSNIIYTTLNNFKYRFGQTAGKNKAANAKLAIINENNIDKIVLQASTVEQLIPVAKLIEKIIKRRHPGDENISVIVPLEILNRHKQSKRVLGIVLGLIAGISLLVGGIGIMNIMLASVYERIKEIGIRKAMGASNKMIAFQFVAEAVIISVSGGIIGVILGLMVSKIVSFSTDINTIVSLNSIILAFIISVLTGVFFGWAPAKKASAQNPVN
ncbi:MAG: FtsX-like permease family protein [Chlorobi bacterium]|nr:FtsX-like permease family protein [Chlorobiota bacterium]